MAQAMTALSPRDFQRKEGRKCVGVCVCENVINCNDLNKEIKYIAYNSPVTRFTVD